MLSSVCSPRCRQSPVQVTDPEVVLLPTVGVLGLVEHLQQVVPQVADHRGQVRAGRRRQRELVTQNTETTSERATCQAYLVIQNTERSPKERAACHVSISVSPVQSQCVSWTVSVSVSPGQCLSVCLLYSVCQCVSWTVSVSVSLLTSRK